MCPFPPLCYFYVSIAGLFQHVFDTFFQVTEKGALTRMNTGIMRLKKPIDREKGQEQP